MNNVIKKEIISFSQLLEKDFIHAEEFSSTIYDQLHKITDYDKIEAIAERYPSKIKFSKIEHFTEIGSLSGGFHTHSFLFLCYLLIGQDSLKSYQWGNIDGLARFDMTEKQIESFIDDLTEQQDISLDEIMRFFKIIKEYTYENEDFIFVYYNIVEWFKEAGRIFVLLTENHEQSLKRYNDFVCSINNDDLYKEAQKRVDHIDDDAYLRFVDM